MITLSIFFHLSLPLCEVVLIGVWSINALFLYDRIQWKKGQRDFWLLSDFCFRYVIEFIPGTAITGIPSHLWVLTGVCIPDICATGIKFLHTLVLSQPQVPIHLLVSELLPPLPLRHATKSGSLACCLQALRNTISALSLLPAPIVNIHIVCDGMW